MRKAVGWLLREMGEEMTKVGDKFVLEVESVFCDQSDRNTKLYKMKGFNSLVFDENGIEKLEKYYRSGEEYQKLVSIGYAKALKEIEQDIASKRWRVYVNE